MSPQSDLPDRHPRRRRRWVRGILFRVAAVCLGVGVLALAELVLRVAGVAETTDAEDPFLDPQAVRPLFVLDSASGRYEIPKSRYEYFRPDSFARDKPASGFRVFCLGGSTVQGRPYAIQTAFSTWLELALRAADPARRWDVVNCGGISYASYRLLPILREVLAYEPDLVIICSGHNEFLEERTYHPASLRSSPFWQAGSAVGQLRLYRVGREAWLALRGQTSSAEHGTDAQLRAEVDALLDHEGGLARYHRDDSHTQWVIKHFRLSLAAMLDRARVGGVPVMVVDPPANLKDCSPFKSEDTPGVTPDDLETFQELCQAAAAVPWSDAAVKTRLLEQAVRINPRYAGALFRLGKCYEIAGRADRALEAFLRAKDEDACPLRIIEPMRSVIRTLADRTRTPLIDAQGLLAKRCAGRILGDEVLVDHVHPSITGHQIIADALVRQMIADGLVEPKQGWQDRRVSAFARHIASLSGAYFQKGLQRLERVQRWARARWRMPQAQRVDAPARAARP